jgi:hypothetical protein
VPLRNVRVPDALWADALAAVELRGDESLSHVIREGLTRYVAATDRMIADGRLPRHGGGGGRTGRAARDIVGPEPGEPPQAP